MPEEGCVGVRSRVEVEVMGVEGTEVECSCLKREWVSGTASN